MFHGFTCALGNPCNGTQAMMSCSAQRGAALQSGEHASGDMDQVTFHHDTVLSDVHLHLPNTRHLMARLNRVGQPVFTSKFQILRNTENPEACDDVPPPAGDEFECDTRKTQDSEEADWSHAPRPALDEDGDLEVRRVRPRPDLNRAKVCPTIISQSERPAELEEEEEDYCSRDVIQIQHTMATTLEDVGKQVWRGAFLLADFILSQPITFKGATVLELGAGTGIASIVMATMAKTVYCTDVGEDLLSMCETNVSLNCHLLEPTGGRVCVRQLDWLSDSLCTDTDAEFTWSEEEVADLHDNTTFVIAADVCYDDDLTDAFFRTLYRITSNLRHSSAIYLSLEKRLNFTLRHLDVSCEAYDHFRRCLAKLEGVVGRVSFRVERILTVFPQYLQYERVEQLELWKVIAEPVETPHTPDPIPTHT